MMARALLGAFAVAFTLGFVIALAAAAGRKRPKPPTGTLLELMVPRPRPPLEADLEAEDLAWSPILREAVRRQTERLRAELDDDAAVDAWLAGGTR